MPLRLGGDGTYLVLGQVLDKDLALMTPIYYDSGWLVARLPPTGQAPTSGALAPMPDAIARNLDKLASKWTLELGLTVKGNFGCNQRWRTLGPGAPPCFSAVQSPFQHEQTLLAGPIHAAGTTLHGACSQLAKAALVTTRRLELDLRRIAAAAAAPDRTTLPAAFALGNADETNLDLTGQLDRFVILCTPRNLAEPQQR